MTLPQSEVRPFGPIAQGNPRPPAHAAEHKSVHAESGRQAHDRTASFLTVLNSLSTLVKPESPGTATGQTQAGEAADPLDQDPADTSDTASTPHQAEDEGVETPDPATAVLPQPAGHPLPAPSTPPLAGQPAGAAPVAQVRPIDAPDRAAGQPGQTIPGTAPAAPGRAPSARGFMAEPVINGPVAAPAPAPGAAGPVNAVPAPDGRAYPPGSPAQNAATPANPGLPPLPRGIPGAGTESPSRPRGPEIPGVSTGQTGPAPGSPGSLSLHRLPADIPSAPSAGSAGLPSAPAAPDSATPRGLAAARQPGQAEPGTAARDAPAFLRLPAEDPFHPPPGRHDPVFGGAGTRRVTRVTAADFNPVPAPPAPLSPSLPGTTPGALSAFEDISDSPGPQSALLDPARPGAGTVLRADPPMARPELARHIAAQISDVAHSAKADGRVEILLDPKELGRVRIALSGGEAAISVTVTADRPETLDLLKRHVATLAAEFSEIGYHNAAFAFGQDGDSSAFRQGAGAPLPPMADLEVGPATLQPQPRTLVDDRLDIRI